MINQVKIEGTVVYLKKIDEDGRIITNFTIKTEEGDYFYVSIKDDIDIRKGKNVLVEGKLKQIRWISSSGEWRSLVQIIAKNVQMQQKRKKKKETKILDIDDIDLIEI
jgi:hypothetical protein